MAPARRRWLRRAALGFGVLLVLYVGSYAAFYARGLAEARQHGYPYFFYVPVADVAAARDTTRRHQILGPVYDPINQLRRGWFGGRSACRCVMFGLGG